MQSIGAIDFDQIKAARLLANTSESREAAEGFNNVRSQRLLGTAMILTDVCRVTRGWFLAAFRSQKNPVTHRVTMDSGSEARLYMDGTWDLHDPEGVAVSPGFSSFAELEAWENEQRRPEGTIYGSRGYGHGQRT